ncbi:metallophosphoesterase family protein [Treponema socranskii]|uniref:metallophosphoesterase family protein n=1 Tax=Treponema TaxID=157 RepID=UPI002871115B|nr:metallophosphoesterase [Treponema socranskii]MDR9859378.1 metallophosphoesterase [Treponema socranskii]
MKILCVSDMIDPLIYNQNASSLFSDIDMILCAGDLPMDYVDFIVSMFNKPTYFIFGNHNLNEFHYYHSSAHAPAEKRGETHGHGAAYCGFRVIRDKTLSFADPVTGKKTPLLIAGVSGSRKYNNGLNQYSEGEMKRRLIGMIPSLLWNKLRYGRYLDIFLTHASPRGIHDKEDPCHVGFECFNWFIKKFSPVYLVHGHIHLYDIRDRRVTETGATTVVNAYAHCLIEFPKTGGSQ